MVLLLKISVENILHRINHLHHNNKSADDNIFAFEAEGTVNNSKQHHQCTGDNAGNLILGKNIFVLQIRGLIGADTIASHLQKQLCSSVA